MNYGFLQEATIGNKEGNGRTKRYILSRRLAPFFSLVPTSFAGYLFILTQKKYFWTSLIKLKRLLMKVIGSKHNIKLRNLVEAMGGMFQAVLLSDTSQRRIFLASKRGVYLLRVWKKLRLSTHSYAIISIKWILWWSQDHIFYTWITTDTYQTSLYLFK